MKFKHLAKSGLDNRAAENIVVWLKAIVQYATAASAVRPQLERVKRWQLVHDAKEKELHKVEKLLAKADQTVADLCADANAALRDLDASTANMRMLKTRVDNVNTVLRGLAGDAARWKSELAYLWTGHTSEWAVTSVERMLSGNGAPLEGESSSGSGSTKGSKKGSPSGSPKKEKKSAKGKKAKSANKAKKEEEAAAAAAKDAAERGAQGGDASAATSAEEKEKTLAAAAAAAKVEKDPLGKFIATFSPWLVPALLRDTVLEASDGLGAGGAEHSGAAKGTKEESVAPKWSDDDADGTKGAAAALRLTMCVARVSAVGDAAAAAVLLSYGGALPAAQRARLAHCAHARLAQSGVPFTRALLGERGDAVADEPVRLLTAMFAQDAGIGIAGAFADGALAHAEGVRASDAAFAKRAAAMLEVRMAAAKAGGEAIDAAGRDRSGSTSPRSPGRGAAAMADDGDEQRLGFNDAAADSSGGETLVLKGLGTRRWSAVATGLLDGEGESPLDQTSAALAMCSVKPALILDLEGRALAWLKRTGGRCVGAKGAGVGGVRAECTPSSVGLGEREGGRGDGSSRSSAQLKNDARRVIVADVYDSKIQTHLESALTLGSTLVVVIGADRSGAGERREETRPLLPTATQVDRTREWGVAWGAHHGVRRALLDPGVSAVVGADPADSRSALANGGPARRQGSVGAEGAVHPMLLATLRHAMQRHRGGSAARAVRLEGNLSVEVHPHFRIFLVAESRNPFVPDSFRELVNIVRVEDDAAPTSLMLQHACAAAFPWIEEQRSDAAGILSKEVS